MDRTPTEWMIEPLRRYAQFTGRARRAEYWWFALAAFLASIAASLIDHVLGLKVGIGTALSLALFIPQLAVAVRRLHDIDRTGWWLIGALVFAIPLGFSLGLGIATGGGGTGIALVSGLLLAAFGILLLVWNCTPGTAGPNRFGADPLSATG